MTRTKSSFNNKVTFKKPKPKDAHDEFMEDVRKDRINSFFPEPLKLILHSLSNIEFFTVKLRKAKIVKINQHYLNNIENISKNDMIEPNKLLLLSKNEISFPVVLFHRKDNRKWILSGKPEMLYIYKKLRIFPFSIMEITI